MDFVFFFIACLAVVDCVLDRSEWDCLEESSSSAPWKITRSLNEDCGSALIVWGQISGEAFAPIRANVGSGRPLRKKINCLRVGHGRRKAFGAFEECLCVCVCGGGKDI